MTALPYTSQFCSVMRLPSKRSNPAELNAIKLLMLVGEVLSQKKPEPGLATMVLLTTLAAPSSASARATPPPDSAPLAAMKLLAIAGEVMAFGPNVPSMSRALARGPPPMALFPDSTPAALPSMMLLTITPWQFFQHPMPPALPAARLFNTRFKAIRGDAPLTATPAPLPFPPNARFW